MKILSYLLFIFCFFSQSVFANEEPSILESQLNIFYEKFTNENLLVQVVKIEKKENKYVLHTKVLNEVFNKNVPFLNINIQGKEGINISLDDTLMFTNDTDSYLLNKDNVIIGKIDKTLSINDFGILGLIFCAMIFIVGGTVLLTLFVIMSSVPMG